MSMKRVKVSKTWPPTFYGVAARSLEECIEKGCNYLKIGDEDFQHVEHDGAIIEDNNYFLSLPNDTKLIFKTHSDEHDSLVEKLRNLLEGLRTPGTNLLELERLARDVSESKIFRCIIDLLLPGSYSLTRCSCENKSEDADWFKGVGNKSWKTKSKVMEESAKSRVRSYFYDARQSLKQLTRKEEQEVGQLILQKWKDRLSKNDYYSCYFSRANHTDKVSFCDPGGLFECEGDYICKECPYSSTLECFRKGHWINPYSTREERIMFSTWNLDHQIEMSRTVMPGLVKLIKEGHGPRINSDYFYDLLFTRYNIRLVHIVCHDKTEHAGFELDMERVFKQDV